MKLSLEAFWISMVMGINERLFEKVAMDRNRLANRWNANRYYYMKQVEKQ